MGSQKLQKTEDKFTKYLAPNLPYPTYYFYFAQLTKWRTKPNQSTKVNYYPTIITLPPSLPILESYKKNRRFCCSLTKDNHLKRNVIK